MWSDDLFRAKWTIVAKAYFDIHDKVRTAQALLHIIRWVITERF
jgi:hypothetical protein